MNKSEKVLLYVLLFLTAVAVLVGSGFYYFNMQPAVLPPMPAPPTNDSENIFCGGIAGIDCPTGYECKLDGFYPDAGGTCVLIQSKSGVEESNSEVDVGNEVTDSTELVCPPNGWVDCMPTVYIDNTKPLEVTGARRCDKDADMWYRTNCPNYQGMAF